VLAQYPDSAGCIRAERRIAIPTPLPASCSATADTIPCQSLRRNPAAAQPHRLGTSVICAWQGGNAGARACAHPTIGQRDTRTPCDAGSTLLRLSNRRASHQVPYATSHHTLQRARCPVGLRRAHANQRRRHEQRRARCAHVRQRAWRTEPRGRLYDARAQGPHATPLLFPPICRQDRARTSTSDAPNWQSPQTARKFSWARAGRRKTSAPRSS